MSIEAKKEASMRLVGHGIIFFNMILVSILDIVALNCSTITIIILVTLLPWIAFFIALKIENEFAVENIQFIRFFLSFYTAGLILIGRYSCLLGFNVISFTFMEISYVLLAICWHYSLTIYKKKKMAFLTCGVGFCVLTIFFRNGMLVARFGWILGLIPLILAIIGMTLIIIAEAIMKKKGFLNYL